MKQIFCSVLPIFLTSPVTAEVRSALWSAAHLLMAIVRIPVVPEAELLYRIENMSHL